MPKHFLELAKLLEKIETTKKRLEIIEWTANFLKTLSPEEIEPTISIMLGNAFQKWSQKTLDVNWSTLTHILKTITSFDWNVFSEAFSKTGDVGSAAQTVLEKSAVKRQALLVEKSLTILEVRRLFEAIAQASGSGSRERKNRLIAVLLGEAKPVEAKFLVKVLIGEMRTGLHEGLMEQAVAAAFGVPLLRVQEAGMVVGDIGEVATILKMQGSEGLEKAGFRVFRPVKLMLAQTARDVEEALKNQKFQTAFEYKIDGARIQIHVQNGKVKIFSRRLTDVTESLPEIVEIIKSNIKASSAIVEGEVVALGSGGYPIAFQHLMRRFKRVHEISQMAKKMPLTLYLFDIIYLNGESLIALSYVQRRRILAQNAGQILLTKQLITDQKEQAESFLKEALDAGHEGLMAKKMDSSYTPGSRKKRWLKIKTVLEPLDLVIMAAEYGYGRRKDWLSDYYLSALDPRTGGFLVVGKTFKGLTDSEMVEVTKQLKENALRQEGHRVEVIPKIVVEVLYNEIQKSPKYKSEMALRFARINRIREDKTPQEVDSIDKVKEIYEKQFVVKELYNKR